MRRIESPCRIGDKVFKVTADLKIKTLIVNGIQVTENGGYVSCRQNRSVVTIPFSEFNITVFTARTKAQSYRAKLRKEQSDEVHNVPESL